jgi:hypothetical protein
MVSKSDHVVSYSDAIQMVKNYKSIFGSVAMETYTQTQINGLLHDAAESGISLIRCRWGLTRKVELGLDPVSQGTGGVYAKGVFEDTNAKGETHCYRAIVVTEPLQNAPNPAWKITPTVLISTHPKLGLLIEQDVDLSSLDEFTLTSLYFEKGEPFPME